MYDLVIIGAGWAGFNAALTAKFKGLNVALVDKFRIGGTCLNLGCIPTKTLIQSARVFALAKKAKNFGIDLGSETKANFGDIQNRKDKIIAQLSKGMEFRLKGVDFFNCQAMIHSPNALVLGDKQVKTKNILIASGSEAVDLENLRFDHKKIITSDEALGLKEIPDSILIVGGGAIGCEFASLFSILGSAVTLIELKSRLLPEEDEEVGKKIETIFKKRGIEVRTNEGVSGSLDLKEFTLVLVCVGRKPRLNGLGLENIGIKLEKNKILVDDYLKTSIANIYAAGDCTGKTMLAHFAAYQGRIAANNAADAQNLKKTDAQYIPNCIFTDPEIASIGLTEQKARELGRDVKVGRIDFLASGMARILDETDGFIKSLIDKKTDKICGVSIVGPKASELIGILSLAMQSGLLASQLKDMIFAHPTLSESVRDVFN